MRIASLALTLLLIAASAGAVTYTIYPDGSGDYPTIQEALDEAVPGDVILLGDGTFTGPLNRNLNTGGTDVTIRSISDDPSLCIIDCQGSIGDPNYGIDFDVVSSATVLRGITITGGYSATLGGALRMTDASPQIINCVFTGNYAYNFGGAVHGSGPSTPYFQDCVFEWNIADYYGQGGAVFVVQECSPEFQNCTFTSNTAYEGSAIYANLDASPIVRQSTFWNNNSQVIKAGEGCSVLVEGSILAFNTGAAVACFGDGLIWVECSDIYGNPGGNWTGCITGLDGIMGNMEANPLMCGAASGDFTLHAASPCAPGNNPTCGLIGAWPVGCWNVSTVAPDGSGDYPTIQAAVNAAVGDGSEIIELLDGTYTGSGNYNVSFLGKALTIRSQSGNAEACIIYPDASIGVPRRAFLFENGEGSDSVLEDLTFTDCLEDHGAAVYIVGAGPTINGCIFKENHTGLGALYYQSYDAGQILTVFGCTFIGNSNYGDSGFGSAIFSSGNAPFAISDCQFIENTASGLNPGDGAGGAVVVVDPTGSFTRCSFVRNSASGIGGAIGIGGDGFSLLLVNCTFVGNSAPQGSAIFNELSSLVIQNCIIASGEGGPNIHNNTLYGDVGTINLSCTDIFGNEGGDWIPEIADQLGVNGNIAANPQFCDSRIDDYTITASSPCAPFSSPNQYCELIGANPVGCDYAGAITAVADVAGDQGRQVRVSWARSSQDGYGTPYDVTEYSLWRRVDGPPPMAAQESELAAAHEGRYPPGDWDFVTTIPARAEANYSVVCETLCDSTIADGMCSSTFFVSAETSGYLVFFDSEPASGYSVDNLAPGVPFNFHLDSPTLLVWDESSDADFDYFSAYGSEVDVFDGSAVLIDNTTGTSLDVTGTDYPYYFLTAFDFSGNESEAAGVAADNTAIANEDRIPGSFALHLGTPNPVRTHTTIGFDLPRACRVSLSVYDVSGRRVTSLVDSEMPAGSHSVRWVVSGEGPGSRSPRASTSTAWKPPISGRREECSS